VYTSRANCNDLTFHFPCRQDEGGGGGLERIDVMLDGWYEVYRRLMDRSRCLKAHVTKCKVESALRVIDHGSTMKQAAPPHQDHTMTPDTGKEDADILKCIAQIRRSMEHVKGSTHLGTWIAKSHGFFSPVKTTNDHRMRIFLDSFLDSPVSDLLHAEHNDVDTDRDDDASAFADAASTTTLLDTIERQECMQKPYSMIQGHIEILIQFGIIAMFAPVFPLGPVLAFLNNVVEIRMEISGAVSHTQRFCSHSTKEPDIFIGLLNFMSAFSVMFSCVVILMQTDLLDMFNIFASERGDGERGGVEADDIVVLVVIEHIVIAMKFTLYLTLPDVPEWIELAEVGTKRKNIESESEEGRDSPRKKKTRDRKGKRRGADGVQKKAKKEGGGARKHNE
jgi:hypothetical protein